MDPYNTATKNTVSPELKNERDANRAMAEGCKKIVHSQMAMSRGKEKRAEARGDSSETWYQMGRRHGLQTAKNIFLLGS